QILYISPAYEEIWGRSCQSLYDDPQSFLAAIHPADRQRVERSVAQHGFVGVREEYRIIRPDGRVVWIHDHGFAIRHDDGTIYRVAGHATDITERKRLEEQLLQAQKMEGIGRLAGGIAHDFNNLLTAIIGYAEFIEDSLLPDDPRHSDVEQILKAATRATGMTRQLLTFARKQVIAPQVINLNELVLGTTR